MSGEPRVLVVDDDADVVDWLVESLGEEGFDTAGETDARAALRRIAVESFDVVVSDVEMPGMRGTQLLQAILKERPQQAVLLITAFGSIDLAVDSVRSGAVDFIAKPFRIEVLALALRRALRERQLRRELSTLRASARSGGRPRFAVQSSVMKSAVELARRAATSHLPVMLTGESGVGKGALARFVHECSPRSAGAFVHLNCAALPAGLVEAELFGVRRGAFTDAREDRPGVFAQAHGGTLFLDEIGELPLEIQPKLLQVLESSRVRPVGASQDVPADARIVAATNQPLEESVQRRRFRADLYHRLNVIRIEIPPLRERPEDIEPIVLQALGDIAQRAGRAQLSIAPEALRRLGARAWPGNVRELLNAIERAAALTDRDVLTPEDFEPRDQASHAAFLDLAIERDLSLQELEQAYIARILRKVGGHKGNAARILGVDRRTLYRKVAELEGREPSDDVPGE